MFKALGRGLAFLFGLTLLLEAALPVRIEHLRVDQHTSSTHRRTQTSTVDTSYTLHLVGGKPSSCSVGMLSYQRLNDGDEVEVQSTKVFRRCVRISRGDELIDYEKYWRLFALLSGGLLVAAAFGWVKDDDEGEGFRIRL